MVLVTFDVPYIHNSGGVAPSDNCYIFGCALRLTPSVHYSSGICPGITCVLVTL